MSVFKKILGKKHDPLIDQASNLVSVSHLAADIMFTPALKRFPFLGNVDENHWDYIVTVAGVFIAATRLNNLKLDSNREDALMDIVSAKLQEWDRDSPRAFEDCKSLFEAEFDRLTNAGHEARFVAADALGLWIVWNVLGKKPQAREEIDLIRVVGSLSINNFFGWWAK